MNENTIEPRSAERRSSKNAGLLKLYVALVAIAGAGLLIAGITQATSQDAIVLGALVLACAGAEVFAVKLFAESHVSVSGAAMMAAGAIFGLWGIVFTAPVITIAGQARDRYAISKSFFNFGSLTLAGAAYVAVFRQFDTSLGGSGFSNILLPAVVAGMANMAVNSTLVAGAISLDEGSSIIRVWRGNFLWLVPQYAVLGLVGIGLALALISFGVWSLFLFALPLVSLSEALHTRAEAMRMRNRALETIASVQDRRRAA